MAMQAVLLKRDAYPHDVLFTEQDGILWLRGNDLKQARKVLGFCTDGQECIGLDGESASYYIHALLEQGMSVGVVRGNDVRTITMRGHKDPAKVAKTTIWLQPVLLYGNREMARLCRYHTRKHAPMAAAVERFRQELLKGNESALRDVAELYVCQVGPDMYDIDLELTAVGDEVVEALAVAAHLAGAKLCCQLVLPKAKRGRKNSDAKPKLTISEPVTYGQLRLFG